MPPAVKQETESLESGYRVVPLHCVGDGAPLRVCLVVKTNPGPVGGAFIRLRETADASVYLGATADASGRVREWLEIWVQNIDAFAAEYPAYRDSASNAVLDAQWAHRAEAFRALEPASFLATGWEDAPPAPIFFDLNLRETTQPAEDAPGGAWEICRDDALLAQKGLPAYHPSLARYLHQPAAGTATIFVPITTGALENSATRPLAEAFPSLLPFNPGGRMLARTFSPLAFNQWLDVLSGVPWRGVDHGGDAIRLGGIYRTLQDPAAMQYGGGHLFLGNRGLAGRLAETFHLKLQALAAAFRLVRAHVRASQLPLLNVSEASFRVSLAASDTALPFLWNFRTSLVVPGEAVALPVATTEARYFIPAKFGGTSVYRPAALLPPVDATGQVRIRQLQGAEGGKTIIEGTLVTPERLTPGGSDLLWLRLSLPSGRVDLYARCEAAEGSTAGEVRFRTLPQELPPGVVTALQQAEGVPFSNVPFQTVPLLSSPCDLYALGVLAARALLVDEEMALPVAIDELFSLARQSATTFDPDQSSGERVEALARGRKKIAEALGPHRLLREKIAPGEVPFPRDLWWETIALIIRCFPGSGPDSFCRDLGDAAPLAPEDVFQAPLAELEKLLLRSRSLIVVDWNYNREIRSVIGKFMERVAAHSSH